MQRRRRVTNYVRAAMMFLVIWTVCPRLIAATNQELEKAKADNQFKGAITAAQKLRDKEKQDTLPSDPNGRWFDQLYASGIHSSEVPQVLKTIEEAAVVIYYEASGAFGRQEYPAKPPFNPARNEIGVEKRGRAIGRVTYAHFVRSDNRWQFLEFRQRYTFHFLEWGEEVLPDKAKDDEYRELKRMTDDLVAKLKSGDLSLNFKGKDWEITPFYITSRGERETPGDLRDAFMNYGVATTIRKREFAVLDLDPGRKAIDSLMVMFEKSSEEWKVTSLFPSVRIAANPLKMELVDQDGKPIDGRIADDIRKLFLSDDLSKPCKKLVSSQEALDRASPFLIGAYKLRKNLALLQSLKHVGKNGLPILRDLVNELQSGESESGHREARLNAIISITEDSDLSFPVIDRLQKTDRWEYLPLVTQYVIDGPEDFSPLKTVYKHEGYPRLLSRIHEIDQLKLLSLIKDTNRVFPASMPMLAFSMVSDGKVGYAPMLFAARIVFTGLDTEGIVILPFLDICDVEKEEHVEAVCWVLDARFDDVTKDSKVTVEMIQWLAHIRAHEDRAIPLLNRVLKKFADSTSSGTEQSVTHSLVREAAARAISRIESTDNR